MIKHKKVTRIVIAAFMALCLFMGPLASSPKAATAGSGTAVSGSTTVCTYSWTFVNNGIYDIGTNLGFVKSSMHVDIDLTAYYSGALTITLSGTSSFANIGIFVKGGYLASTSTNQCKIQLIANVSHIEVDFISSVEFTSVPNWSVTVSASGINKIDDLEHTSLDNIDDYTGRISAAVTSTTNGIPAIYNELDSIDNALTVIKSYVDNIEGYIDGIESYLGSIDSNTSTLSALAIDSYSYSAYYYALKYGTFYNNYSTWAGSSVGIPTIILNRYATPSYDGNYSIVVPAGVTYHYIYICSGNPVFDYYQENVGLLNATNYYYDYISGWRMYDLIYTNTSSNSVSLSICMSRNAAASVVPLYFGSHIPDKLSASFGFEYDNTYTRLITATNNGLTTINDTLNGLKSQTITNTDRIVTALQNLQQQVIVNQNSQTVIDMSTNTTNTINQQFQTINNVELTILDGIGTKFNNVNTAIDNSGVISGSVNNTGIGWANYYSGIVLDHLTIVKYPVYIILIGFVLLCLLG